MFNKKIILYPTIFLLIFSIIGAASAVCTSNGTITSTKAFTNMLYNTTQYFPIDSATKFSSATSIKPTTNISIVVNETEKLLINTSTTSLRWPAINNGTGYVFTVVNSSHVTDVLGSGNYSVNWDTGVITWNLRTGAGNWNNTNVSILYNKTFIAGTTDLTGASYTFAWSYVNSGADYNSAVGWKISTTDLNNTNWTTTYSLLSRDCNAETACQSTKVTIFAGFGLIALFAIIVAGWAVIKVFEMGDMSLGIMATVISIIGLGVIVLIGYIVIDKVAFLLC